MTTTIDMTRMTEKERTEIVKRAAKGDTSTLPALRAMLQDDPAMVRQMGGELAEMVQVLVIANLTGKSLSWQEAVFRKLALIRDELLGPNPTPIERLLAERVATCWLHVQEAEIWYAEHSSKPGSFAQADFDQRRLNAANKRYLAALKTLAQVRKLAVPVLQLNIASKQLNVAGGVVAPAGA